ncbi:MAG: LysR family transcriptional regulator [Desulfobacterales bacterium]|jgi:DNA-binding transcriptional LysR family regulator
MNLNQLKLFYLAIKRQSLSNAATELNITQPAVTKGIQRLQEYYEIKFVERQGKKLELTNAGAALYEIAEQIFSMEKLAEERIHSFQVEEGSQLRIHASESFGAYYLPVLVNQFKALNPAIRVTVDILPTDKIIDTTIGLQNEIGFISYPVEHEKLILTEVLKENLVIIVSPRHRLASLTELRPRDLEGKAMIMHEHGSALQMAVEKFLDQENVHISKYLEFSNNEAIKRAVAEGDGIALISEKVAAEEIMTGKLIAIPVAGQQISRTFYMIQSKNKFVSRPLADLIEMIQKWVVNSTQNLS